MLGVCVSHAITSCAESKIRLIRAREELTFDYLVSAKHFLHHNRSTSSSEVKSFWGNVNWFSTHGFKLSEFYPPIMASILAQNYSTDCRKYYVVVLTGFKYSDDEFKSYFEYINSYGDECEEEGFGYIKAEVVTHRSFLFTLRDFEWN